MKFKKGQEVKITDNLNGHLFEIGEIVEIVKVDKAHKDYLCSNGGYKWYLRDEEIEECNPKTITTYENQPIEELAKEVAELVKKEWGSHNIEPFIEAFKKEVGR